MKKYIGVVAIALAAAFAVWAADKDSSHQTLVRLKADGKTVAELRILDGGKVLINSESIRGVKGDSTTFTAVGATLCFGGASGSNVTVKAEEAEFQQIEK